MRNILHKIYYAQQLTFNRLCATGYMHWIMRKRLHLKTLDKNPILNYNVRLLPTLLAVSSMPARRTDTPIVAWPVLAHASVLTQILVQQQKTHNTHDISDDFSSECHIVASPRKWTTSIFTSFQEKEKTSYFFFITEWSLNFAWWLFKYHYMCHNV